MEKRTILLVKIKPKHGRIKVVEAKKADGWSDKDIRKFVKGVQGEYPDAEITTSTISKT